MSNLLATKSRAYWKTGGVKALFLNKEEKIIVLLFRIEMVKVISLFGGYKSYEIGENKIRKLKRKIEKLGGDSSLKLNVE